jgi:hypothetical protein
MLFDCKIEPCCGYCRYGTAIGEGEVMCKKRGIVSAFGSCGVFCYEPTKRMPEVSPPLDTSRFTEEDFVV